LTEEKGDQEITREYSREDLGMSTTGFVDQFKKLEIF